MKFIGVLAEHFKGFTKGTSSLSVSIVSMIDSMGVFLLLMNSTMN